MTDRKIIRVRDVMQDHFLVIDGLTTVSEAIEALKKDEATTLIVKKRNDNDEFGRLTGMDEKMLQMLYDVRLKPGLDADSAMPIVTTLARDLTQRRF